MNAQTTTVVTSPTGRKISKPTPTELMEDTGTGLNYGTRPDRMPGYLTPTDRFFIRNHAPTPHLDTATWTLHVEGNGMAPRCIKWVWRSSDDQMVWSRRGGLTRG
jgi:hypothetical protein